MKQILIILSTLLFSSFAFAADETPVAPQPYQPVCLNEAAQVATGIFSLNNGNITEFNTEYSLIDANAAEGGYEIYEFIMTLADGTKSTPYRVTTTLPGCKVIDFETPFEN